MTINSRNYLFTSGIITLIILLLVVSTMFLESIHIQSVKDMLHGFLKALLFDNNLYLKSFLSQIANLVIAITILQLFRKTASAEIFFIACSVFCFGIIDSLVIVKGYVILHGLPLFYGALILRSIILFRLIAFFSIFASGLFPSGLEYQKIELVMGTIFLSAFTLSAFIPVGFINAQTSNSAALPGNYDLIFMVILVSGFINFLVAGFKRSTKEYILAGIGLLFISAGREFLFQTGALPLYIAGLSLYMAGTAYFIKKIHEIYLWV